MQNQDSVKLRAGYIGLGAMGEPMAAHLARAGYLKAVYNRTASKASQFATSYTVQAAQTPQALAEQVDVIFLNVSADADVCALIDAMRPALRPGHIIVDNSTISPATAQSLAQSLAALGVGMLDAPVSGGVEGAKNAKLSVMIGGEEALLEQLRPMFACFAARITHLGAIGSGQACKAVNQVMVAGIAQGVCEALAMAEKLALPQDKLLAVLTGGAGNSWFLEKRGSTMLNDEFQSGFKLGLLLKDLNIVAALGKSLGLTQSVVAQSIADYTALVAAGRGDEEISALIRRKRG